MLYRKMEDPHVEISQVGLFIFQGCFSLTSPSLNISWLDGDKGHAFESVDEHFSSKYDVVNLFFFVFFGLVVGEYNTASPGT